jgi:hypothetical protein
VKGLLVRKTRNEAIDKAHGLQRLRDIQSCVNGFGIMKCKEVFLPAIRSGYVLFPDNLDNFGVCPQCSVKNDYEVRSMNMTLIINKKGEWL